MISYFHPVGYPLVPRSLIHVCFWAWWGSLTSPPLLPGWYLYQQFDPPSVSFPANHQFGHWLIKADVVCHASAGPINRQSSLTVPSAACCCGPPSPGSHPPAFWSCPHKSLFQGAASGAHLPLLLNVPPIPTWTIAYHDFFKTFFSLTKESCA